VATRLDPELPLVTIVIPVRNEKRHVLSCLRSLSLSDYPSERIEIVVVDGLSTDGSKEVVLEFQREHENVRLVENPHRFTPHGMNIGIRLARGEYILVASGHAVFPPDFLRTAVEHFHKIDADVVGGPIVTTPSARTVWSNAIASVRSHRFGVGNSRFRTDSSYRGYVEALPFGVYKRDAFKRFGYFDERLLRNQDSELQARMRLGGAKIFMAPELATTYFAEHGFWVFCLKSFRCGFWNTKSLLAGCAGMRPRHFIPGVFVLSVILGVVGSSVFRSLSLGLWILIGLYLLGIVTSSIQLFVRKPSLSALVVPLAFLCCHIAYGMGNLIAAPLGFRLALNRLNRRIL
jgi:cellulose synthase/poly-beta-1,6-N-acetylglucosamine synthase-like glycosyltransferase